jgi:hypothetical protein
MRGKLTKTKASFRGVLFGGRVVYFRGTYKKNVYFVLVRRG